MDDGDFESIQDYVRKLEKSALDYKPYQGDITVEMCVDFSPPEFMDMDYQDLLNSFERVEKIRSTRRMNIFEKKEAPTERLEISAEEKEKSRMIESNLKEMTSETQEMVEKVGAEMEKSKAREAVGEVERSEIPVEEKLPSEQTIEFETISTEEKKKVDETAEHEEAVQPLPKTPEVPLTEPEKVTPPVKEKKPEEKKAEELVFKVSMPSILGEDPNEAAEKAYEEMQKKVKNTLGKSVDESELKKKMLNLTKQLFKEKSVNKREELKAEIAVLKNILSGKTMKGKGKQKVTQGIAHSQLLESIVGNQKSEFASTKEKITGPFRKQLENASKKYYDSITGKNPKEKKEMYANFVQMLHSLSEQVPEVVQSYQDYLMQKHVAEIEKLEQSLSNREKKIVEDAEERENKIRESYPEELSKIQNILALEINNTIEEAGEGIEPLEEEKEMKKPTISEESKDIIFEINDLDEGTLLYYLHSKDKDYYKKYERRSVSKAEALLKAKALMAKEKGLSDNMIRKYFSDKEE